jgi:hypothetical protein
MFLRLTDHSSRSPTECGVSECDRKASTMRGPWPSRGCQAMQNKYTKSLHVLIYGAVTKLWPNGAFY